MTTNTKQPSTRTQGTRAPGTGQSGMQSGMGQSGMGGMNALRGAAPLAGSLLFLLGVFHFFAGIAGFARRNFYTVGGTYPYHLGSYGWGWLHVIGGVLLVLTGLALFSRSNTWARPTGLVLAVVSAVLNFFFLPFFPLWAFLMLATALFAIGALVREGQPAQPGQQGQISGERMAAQQAGAYTTQPHGAGQTGQRWPENVGGRDESGRQWAPQDVKDTASRAQQQAQAGAQSSGQTARNQTDDAADRARQAAGQAAGQAQNYRPNPNR